MKIALCTIIDDNFLIGFKVFWKSFIHFNPWFNHDFVVLDGGLSEKSKKEITDICDRVIFEEIQKDNYDIINMAKTHEKLRKTYYTFEVFRLNYDRIVFMDMDILVLQDLSELFEYDGMISGCKAYAAGKDRLSRGLNTGVFVINKNKQRDNVYRDIINYSKDGFSMPDQHAINGFFSEDIEYFNKKYNVEKRMLHSKKYSAFKNPNNIACLHFVAWKPWQDKSTAPKRERTYEQFERLWREWEKK